MANANAEEIVTFAAYAARAPDPKPSENSGVSGVLGGSTTYRLWGWYVSGSAGESFTSASIVSTNPDTGHALTNLQILAQW